MAAAAAAAAAATNSKSTKAAKQQQQASFCANKVGLPQAVTKVWDTQELGNRKCINVIQVEQLGMAVEIIEWPYHDNEKKQQQQQQPQKLFQLKRAPLPLAQQAIKGLVMSPDIYYAFYRCVEDSIGYWFGVQELEFSNGTTAESDFFARDTSEMISENPPVKVRGYFYRNKGNMIGKMVHAFIVNKDAIGYTKPPDAEIKLNAIDVELLRARHKIVNGWLTGRIKPAVSSSSSSGKTSDEKKKDRSSRKTGKEGKTGGKEQTNDASGDVAAAAAKAADGNESEHSSDS